MRIDAHQHFWIYHPVKDAWIDDSMQKIQRNFLPSDLFPILQAHDFEGCIAVQADESVNETRFLLNLADQNDWIKGVVGWLDFFDPELGATLDFFSTNKKLKGLRHIVQGKPAGYMLQPDFLRGISLLEKYGLTYDLLVYQHQLEEVIQLVEHFPNQKFVLDHIGKPKMEGKPDVNWSFSINKLAKHPNVSCKLSGLVTESVDWKWQQVDFDLYIDVIVNSFGTDRLLFGSDWPVQLLASEYHEALHIVLSYFKDYASDEVDKIMGLNARRFYNL
ncbi:amidohydrolase family protein [Flavobacterium fluviatile]|uniref:amidohydrolase family protein n=1 Tax=Flavobacterium fluviatile TaxID=1862387 RepID=UPI0013D16B26|nr:amidohydrolase family protein [Flavobacterium fluviatile]